MGRGPGRAADARRLPGSPEVNIVGAAIAAAHAAAAELQVPASLAIDEQ